MNTVNTASCMVKYIHARVPQGSVLGPVQYLLFTQDILQIANTTRATETAGIAVNKNIVEGSNKLQKISRCN